VYAVGETGVIARYNGTAWSLMNSGTTQPLYAIYGTGPSDIYAVGGVGTILHWDGYVWAPMDSQSFEDANAVWASKDIFTLGASGTILRRTRTCAATETSCGDKVDNDCDGRIDCSDPDCTGDATCIAGGICSGATAITCGIQEIGTTVGENQAIKSYACDPWLELGREKIYRISRPTSGLIQLTLAGLSNDLDLVVLQPTASGGCEATFPGCYAASSGAGRGNENININATAGQTYYVIVEGFGSNSGTFVINSNCP
jgi:hypothetical protein